MSIKFRNLKRTTEGILVHSIQLKRETCMYEFPIAWMEKRDNLSEQSCIFHAWTNTENWARDSNAEIILAI